MTEERASAAGTEPESDTGSALDRASRAIETADEDRIDELGEDGDSDIEVVEESQDEEEADAVINIPLAISFFLGGVGFLVVFAVSTISGTHVIIGLLWSSLTFVSLSIIGYLTDALIEFPGIAPVESAGEEEDAELIADLEEERAIESALDESGEEPPDSEVEIGITAGDNDVNQGNDDSETAPPV